MNGIRAVRKIATMQRRNMSMHDLFENKNKIADVRKAFYSNPEAGAGNPTYLKETGDNAVTGVALGVTGLGLVLIINGIWNMAYGINKK